MLHPILHRFAMFNNVASLSLNSLSIHYFNEVDIIDIFGHFFPTLRELNLEGPRSSVNGLIQFLLHFRVLDDFSICDPEWDDEGNAPFVPASAELPPFRGELHFMRLHADSVDFITHLARIPVAFRRVLMVNCQLPPASINQLLDRLSPSLRSFSMSAWFDGELKGLLCPALPADNPNTGECFPTVDLSPCTGIQEVRFFTGMIPVVTSPSQRIRETLASVSSRQAQTIVLDFIVDDGVGVVNEDFFRGFAGLDVQLKRIASEYEGIGKTVVKLSANVPFDVLGPYFAGFGTHGILDFGSRIDGSLHCRGV